MNVKELMDKLDVLDDDVREEFLGELFGHFCPLSLGTLTEFQHSWDGSKTWEEFKQEQNKLVIECIKLETSIIGKHVRKILNLDDLDMDTEL